MTSERREDQPQKGYFEGMPTHIKVLAPLTVVMLVVGFMVADRNQVLALNLICPVAIVLTVRFFLSALFEIGPKTIFGYTTEYGFEYLIRRYRFFPLVLIAGFTGLILYAVYFSDGPS